jgi:hypothetical protein
MRFPLAWVKYEFRDFPLQRKENARLNPTEPGIADET